MAALGGAGRGRAFGDRVARGSLAGPGGLVPAAGAAAGGAGHGGGAGRAGRLRAGYGQHRAHRRDPERGAGRGGVRWRARRRRRIPGARPGGAAGSGTRPGGTAGNGFPGGQFGGPGGSSGTGRAGAPGGFGGTSEHERHGSRSGRRGRYRWPGRRAGREHPGQQRAGEAARAGRVVLQVGGRDRGLRGSGAARAGDRGRGDGHRRVQRDRPVAHAGRVQGAGGQARGALLRGPGQPELRRRPGILGHRVLGGGPLHQGDRRRPDRLRPHPAAHAS